MTLPLLLLALVLSASTARAQSPDGAALYAARCAGCHPAIRSELESLGTGVTTGDSRAPSIDALKGRSPESIIDALTGGAMRYQGLSLSGAERRAIAEHVTGKAVGAGVTNPDAGRCGNAPASGRRSSKRSLAVDDLPKLKVKWAFGFPETTAAWSQPTISNGRVYVGSQNGFVYALDAERGCIVWSFEARGGVRSSVLVEGRRAYFADQVGYAYAVDARTGKQLWRRQVENHPLVRLTGTPLLFSDRLYVPTSSYEEVGKGPDYACCTFRGSVVALNAQTGAVVWKSYVIDEPARVLGKNAQGIDSLGPSGGAIWSAPIVDTKRRRLYVGTGNTYSGTTQPAADAIVALDLKTGRKLWAKQLHPDDVYGCRPGEPNCGERAGPDADFGASPVLAKLPSGRDIIIAGQKSGIGYALDPDDHGEVLWQYRAGRGGQLGGIQWGIAADTARAYFPVADIGSPQPGGLHAVRLATGEREWLAAPISTLLCGQPRRGCTAAQSAAITLIPGAVLSGAFDGGLRAYSTKDGSIVWEFDTNREFATVNGVAAKGGSLNGPAPVVASGTLFVSSGDYRGRPGNVLVALSVD
jgi:polyvinyl alcohol dehydrogenase (cytochrome)